MRLLRSDSARLATLYTTVFAVAVIALGVVSVLGTRSALRAQLDARIQAEALALAQEDRTEGMQGVLDAVEERQHTPGALDYGLLGPDGQLLAGQLSATSAPRGWSTLRLPAGETMRILTMSLSGGRRLIVGEDLQRVSVLDGALLGAFGFAFLGVLVLGVATGLALSREVQRRFSAMSGTAQAIIDGDLGRRIPLSGAGDDLDALGATFNRMLDRISALLDSLRQVSNDVAHDLRTPLTRLRQRLEASLRVGDAAEQKRAIEAALSDLDVILDTFTALLRIAQIEAGARRAGFSSVDLSALVTTVVEAFGPSAEEGRRSLEADAAQSVAVEGDAELLTQALVNMVENGLRHTPPGARVQVGAREDEQGAYLVVRDDGPGVPPEELARLFDRFYRLERSRSTPGSGLGLALVAAVARLHDARAELEDAGPGLEARIVFPRERA
jgi:signal transduction histidine kinase